MEKRRSIGRQFILFLVIGAFFLHLVHDLVPHHHHETVDEHTHTLEQHVDHHHHDANTDIEDQFQDEGWLQDLLSFVHYGKSDSPLRTGNQLHTELVKVVKIIPLIVPVFRELPAYRIIDLPYRADAGRPVQQVILFKSRRGPPATA